MTHFRRIFSSVGSVDSIQDETQFLSSAREDSQLLLNFLSLNGRGKERRGVANRLTANQMTLHFFLFESQTSPRALWTR